MQYNYKIMQLHEFIMLKCKEQTMPYTKRFKLRGNSPQINKIRQEVIFLVNQGGRKSERILRLEDQIDKPKAVSRSQRAKKGQKKGPKWGQIKNKKIGLYFRKRICLSTLVGPKKFLSHTPSSKKSPVEPKRIQRPKELNSKQLDRAILLK